MQTIFLSGFRRRPAPVCRRMLIDANNLHHGRRASRIRAFEQGPRQRRLQHRDRDERHHVAEDLEWL